MLSSSSAVCVMGYSDGKEKLRNKPFLTNVDKYFRMLTSLKLTQKPSPSTAEFALPSQNPYITCILFLLKCKGTLTATFNMYNTLI
jgi:hypothetical protein